MGRIRQLAALSVLRGAGFYCLGVGTAMSGLAFDPAIAFELGAALMLALAVAMHVKALTYPRLRRISETEVWILLAESERPPKDEARRMIVGAMTAELSEKALWAAYVALGFLGIAIPFRLLA